MQGSKRRLLWHGMFLFVLGRCLFNPGPLWSAPSHGVVIVDLTG